MANDATTMLEPKPTDGAAARFLGWIERVGNRLPDPVTIFLIGALLVLLISEIAAWAGWSAPDPRDPANELVARSLLRGEGLQWVWTNMVANFTGFHPLGVVLVAMLGIGVAERTGLIGALLRIIVRVVPTQLVVPALVFAGVMSSMAADAGYVVLPPLAAAIFARAGRAPLVGLAAVFAGVAAGFSANLAVTALDPMLAGLSTTGAQLYDPDYIVRPDSNWYFMIASTFMITLVGWGVTRFVVEPRFGSDAIAAQLAAGADGEDDAEPDPAVERRGLLAALSSLLLAGVGILLLVVVEGGPLSGTDDRGIPYWSTALVPILFVLFLIPGTVFGVVTGRLRSDRDVAAMLGESMASMGPYIVLAFFCGQFVAWFGHSNVGTLLAIEGVDFLSRFELSPFLLVLAIVLLSAILNLLVGSASAKWGLLAPVFVPLFMGLGIDPELTQAAYRVGDSMTNAVAPLNPYLVVILVFMRRWRPDAGFGTLVSLMLPFTIAFSIAWIALLMLWMAMGIPLGPETVVPVAPTG